MKRPIALAAAATTAALVAALLGSGGSQAADPGDGSAHDRLTRQSGTVHTDPIARRLNALLARGASDAQIERKLPVVAMNTAVPVHSAKARRWDTDRSTDASEMTYTNKRIFHYEGDPLRVYAGLSWDMPASPVEGDPSGPDGFGIRVSRNVINKGGSLRVCGWELDSRDNEYDCFDATNFWETSERGIAWKFQDKEYWARGLQPPNEDMGFNWDRGTALFAFRLQSRACTQAFARYDHTWEDSEITGYTITGDSFEIHVSNVGHHWARAANVDQIYCG